MNDLTAYLKGYVSGYEAGYAFRVDPPAEWEELKKEHGIGGAGGFADASSSTPPLDPGQAPLAPLGADAPVSAPGSSGSVDSALPAMRQPAPPLPAEEMGEAEALHVHRGMVLALQAVEEMFRNSHMSVPAEMTRTLRVGVAASTFRKVTR